MVRDKVEYEELLSRDSLDAEDVQLEPAPGSGEYIQTSPMFSSEHLSSPHSTCAKVSLVVLPDDRYLRHRQGHFVVARPRSPASVLACRSGRDSRGL